MTSIFIKTYVNDYKWLQYLLPSLDRYAHGFEEVILVTDEGDPPISPDVLALLKRTPLRVIPAPFPTQCPASTGDEDVGYVWQQYIKLHWFRYCTTDSAFLLDSDQLLTGPLAPDDLKHDGKWMWHYRPWSKAECGLHWKKMTDYILRIDTPYEAMPMPGFVLTRTATRRFLDYLTGGLDLWDYMILQDINTMSEYNLYGSFLYEKGSDEYIPNISSALPHKNCLIVQRWSWGGITAEIHDANMAILSDEQ
jgi:hypothetical protein